MTRNNGIRARQNLSARSRKVKPVVTLAGRKPDWDDLRGRAPGATGDQSSEAFVRRLRDGWRDECTCTARPMPADLGRDRNCTVHGDAVLEGRMRDRDDELWRGIEPEDPE